MGKIKSIIKYVGWIFRGKPTKTYIGGWCGLCGKWLADAKFIRPDYYRFEHAILGDAVTICDECSK